MIGGVLPKNRSRYSERLVESSEIAMMMGIDEEHAKFLAENEFGDSMRDNAAVK